MLLKVLHLQHHRKDNEHYGQLRLYYDNLRNNDRVVSVGMLVHEWRRLNPTLNEFPIATLRNRLYRWMKTENIVLRRVTRVAQNTRHDHEVINDFLLYVNEQIQSIGVPGSNIVNIDETNIDFDMVSGMTLADRGSRTVSVRNSGSNGRCTVLLGVTLNGHKLPPLIIFKGKTNGRISREWTGPSSPYPLSCLYAVQENAWIDQKVFKMWIEKVWKQFCIGKEITYLLMDECSVHMCGECVRQIQSCGTEVEFITGGYTGKLIVLDVDINRPFKSFIREQYEQYMPLNTQKPPRLNVAQWVAYAWEKITVDTIKNTWKSIGITDPPIEFQI